MQKLYGHNLIVLAGKASEVFSELEKAAAAAGDMPVSVVIKLHEEAEHEQDNSAI